MDIGIIGLPRSGKTTVFNSATRGKAQVEGYSNRPNVGVAKVRDARLDALERIFHPRRVVPAEVRYVDYPAPPEGVGATRGISGQHLNSLQGADALLLVVRSFDDPAVSHVEESVDPIRDVETMFLDLSIADVEILERRVARLRDGMKGARVTEREALAAEESLLLHMKEALESGSTIRAQGLTTEDRRVLERFQFLTAKPLIVALNIGEERSDDGAGLASQVLSNHGGPDVAATALCGAIEMELSRLDPDDEREMREGLDAGESGLDRLARLSYEVGGLLTFFTGGPKDVRAWTIARGTTALKAAGKIHSDIERGFIRAEAIGVADLAECSSLAEARKRGALRHEGKGYVVQDGDVLNILFNV